MRNYAKALKITVAVFLVLTVFFMSSCGVKTEKLSDISGREYLSGEAKYRSTVKRGSIKAAASDSAELYFDSENGSISFYDKLSGNTWNSLPAFNNDFASVLVIKVLKDSFVYELDLVNSLDNSESIVYEKKDDGITVTYTFSAEDVSVSVPVDFTLDGAFFNASIDTSAVILSENAKLISVAFLPYLGAIRYSENDFDINSFGDWFLVPDGPGGLMYTAVEDEATSSFLFSVYGNEYYEDTVSASIGAYAVKQGDALLSAVITEGEENTLIRAMRANADKKNINRIYPEFIVTPVSGEEGSISVGSSYNGRFTVVYETLEGESADYIGAAVSVRQILVNNGILRDKISENEFPLYISLIGSTDGKKDTVVTSFSQAENLLTILKGKGINDINLILEGMFTGGLSQKNASLLNVLSTLGGEKEFSDLCKYASSQKLNVFAGTNLFSSASTVSPAKNINGEKNIFVRQNPLAPFVGEEEYEMTYLSSFAAEQTVSRFINKIEKLEVPGVCILDSGKLNGDYSSSRSNASETASIYENSVSAVSVHSDIMLSSAGMNTLNFAEYIKDIELYTNIEESGYYTAVPFIPAVLHSSVIYSGKAANLYSAPVLQLLKAVEYGAMPYYVWCFSASSDKYYEPALNDAVDFYLEANKNLGDLTSKRITDHFMYENGVYCTEYEGGIRVFVNYNNYSVIIGDVAVLPYDYLRIG